MKKSMLLALGLSLLLSSCSTNNTPTDTSAGATSSSAEIPDVPRNVNTGDYVCTAPKTGIAAPLSLRLNAGGNMLDQGTRVDLGRFKAQTDLPDTLQDMLYASKSIINNMYYGYSDVDLNALHESTYQSFKKVFPNKLNTYILSDNFFSYSNLTDAQQNQIDDLMTAYLDNIKDGHTFYMDRASTYYENNGGSPTPKLGISMALVPNQDGIILTNVRKDGPAWKAGLRRGDVIVSINGTAVKRTSTDDKQDTQLKIFDDARKDVAAPLNLVVATAGKQRTTTVTPELIKGTDLPWGEVRNDASGSHYYLRIPTFTSVAPERDKEKKILTPIANKVHALVAEAQSKGMDNIVIDLRGNGGGYLTEFVGAVGAFVPDNKATETTRYVDGSSFVYGYNSGKVSGEDSCKQYSDSWAVQNPTKWNGKVTVVVDGDSASASEMFSTIFQKAGLKVIGVPTYGIGSTSTYHFDLPAGRSMSITAGRTLIDGKPLAEHVTPDITSADDLVKLANTGVDNTLQTAYDTMK